MSHHLILVEKADDFVADGPERTIIEARDYIRQPPAKLPRGYRVINLCHDYSYLSLGYYCSLLAEARGQRVIPSVEVMLELGWKRLYSKALPELNALLSRMDRRRPLEGQALTFRAYFGAADDECLAELGQRVYDFFRCPVLEIEIRREQRWEITAVRPLSVRTLRPPQRATFTQALARYTRRRWRRRKPRPILKYRLAVLHDPADKLPPSNPRALRRLARVGASLGVQVDLITRQDYGRLSEFDALFIRETTALDHHTYRFARRAAREGIPVIDDPTSILRCTNKVYLAELFRKHRIPAPRTVIVERRHLRELERELSYPMILKIPDGSFSRGVFKAENREQVQWHAAEMFKDSDVIVAQEYMPTQFDWRVGVLNGEPLYVCQYMMPGKHWQVLKHEGNGRVREGSLRTVAVEAAPGDVVYFAVRAAALIGNGLYGVDAKETAQGVFVIEVNDNPDIWSDCEDRVAKDELYLRLIREFIRRIES